MEAYASRADGPRLSLSEAHRSYCCGSSGTPPRRGRANNCSRRGSASIQGRARSGSQGSQSVCEARKTAGTEKEEVGGQFGAENTSVRFSAGLQQSLEVTLVRQARLRRLVA